MKCNQANKEAPMGPTTLAEHGHRPGANANALRERTQPTRKKEVSNALNLSNIFGKAYSG